MSGLVNSLKKLDWEELGADQYSSMQTFLEALFSGKNSILRLVMMFSLTISSIKPDINKLDGVVGVLKTSARALDEYITYAKYALPNMTNEPGNFTAYVQNCLRELCFTIGSISCRLIQDDGGSTQELGAVRKLNIIQGGIEDRFLPTLAAEVRTKIECFSKITEE